MESTDVGAVSVRRIGARAMSARKMSRDALTVRPPKAAHGQFTRYRGGKARTTIGRGHVTLKVSQQLPDKTTYYEARAGKRDQQTWVERVVE